jgi:hypothetical protein
MMQQSHKPSLYKLPKLTVSNARIVYPEFKDQLRTQSARVLRHHAHTAANGVRLKYLLDFGVLHGDTEYPAFATQQVNALPARIGAANAAPYKVAFAQRPYPEEQEPLDAAATDAEIEESKKQFVFIKDFYETLERFEESLLDNVDEYIHEQLKVNGTHIDVRLHQMITTLDRLYGDITAEDLQFLHQQYRFNFTSTIAFGAQIAQMEKYFNILDTRIPTETLRPSDKINALLRNIQTMDPSHVTQLSAHIQRYKQDNPSITTQNFDALVAYLVTRFHPDKAETTASMGMVHAVATVDNNQKALAFSSTEVQQLIKAALEDYKSTIVSLSAKAAAPTKLSHYPRDTAALYCFVHGYQKSHQGNDCRLMKRYKPFCGQAMAATRPTKFHNLISTDIGLTADQKQAFKELVKAHTSSSAST